MVFVVLESLTAIGYYQKNRDTYLSASSTVGFLQFLISKYKDESKTPKLDRIFTLRAKGIDAYPSYLFEPQMHDVNDYYYLSNVPDRHIVNCNEAGPFSEWKSDELGFRNPQGQLGKEVDFLFIGDSFTEGACENESNTIPGIFRGNNLTVFNLGRGGAGPLFSLATLVEYGAVVNPKMVVWVVFTGNDLANLREEKTTKLVQYLKEDYSQNLFKFRSEVSARLKLHLDSQLENALSRIESGIAIPQNPGYGESLDALEAKTLERSLLLRVASRIKAVVDKKGAKLAIVILNHPNYNHEIQDITAEALKEFSAEYKLQLIEYSRSYLTDNKKKLYTQSIGHFSGNGYQIIGDDIYGRLVKEVR